MRYLLICLTFLMTLSPALIAQSTRMDQLDIPENKKKECTKMLANVGELLKSEQNSEALKEADKLIAYEPKFPWSYMNKALALYRLDSLDECMVLCKTGYDSYGDNHLSWLLTGRIYKYKKKYDEALMCFIESCKKDPRETIGLYEWIRLLVQLKRPQEALSETSYFAHKSGKSDILWGMLAWAHLQLNNIDSAIYYADKSISICSYNDIGNIVMGEAYFAKGDLKKAIKYYGRTIPDKYMSVLEDEIYLGSVMTLASLHLLAGEYDDGISDLKRIKKFEPRRRVAIPYLYLRICLDAMQNKNTDADVQKFKSLLTKDIGLEWDFSKSDAWLAKATLTPQQRTLIEDITKRFKEYVGKK